jgi:predicted DNA-binding protein (UPF0251 family)
MPRVTYFKPAGIPLSALGEVTLGVDELEAIRLRDVTGLEQEECAKSMNLSQSTFQRLLTTAREKVARALVEGRAIRIEGGNYEIVARDLICGVCDHRWTVEDVGESPMPDCPKCGSPEVAPRWHRGRGHGHGGRL